MSGTISLLGTWLRRIAGTRAILARGNLAIIVSTGSVSVAVWACALWPNDIAAARRRLRILSCTTCHPDKTTAWATEVLRHWPSAHPGEWTRRRYIHERKVDCKANRPRTIERGDKNGDDTAKALVRVKGEIQETRRKLSRAAVLAVMISATFLSAAPRGLALSKTSNK